MTAAPSLKALKALITHLLMLLRQKRAGRQKGTITGILGF